MAGMRQINANAGRNPTDLPIFQQFGRGADIASAASIQLPGPDDYFHVTGTTAVDFIATTYDRTPTDIDLLDGRKFWFYCTGAAVFHHNTGSPGAGFKALALQGGANKTLTAGAVIGFAYDVAVDRFVEITTAGATSGGGTVTAVTATAPISSSGGAAPNITHDNSAVTPASYTYASVTVDAKGHVSAASSGTAPVTSVSGTAPISSSGGTTPTITHDASGLGGTLARAPASVTADIKGHVTVLKAYADDVQLIIGGLLLTGSSFITDQILWVGHGVGDFSGVRLDWQFGINANLIQHSDAILYANVRRNTLDKDITFNFAVEGTQETPTGTNTITAGTTGQFVVLYAIANGTGTGGDIRDQDSWGVVLVSDANVLNRPTTGILDVRFTVKFKAREGT